MNIAALTLDTVEASGRTAAIVEYGGRQVSPAELTARVAGIARELVDRGMRANERVVLQMRNGIDLTAVTLAVLAVGGVPVLCDPGLGEEVYLARVEAADARWVIAEPLVHMLGVLPVGRGFLRRHDVNLPPAPEVQHIMLSTSKINKLAKAAPAFEPCPREPSDEAAIVFTGGTTSDPRGVVHTHDSLAAFVRAIDLATSGTPAENVLADTLPQVICALGLGRTAFVTPHRIEKRARYICEQIEAGTVDSHFGSPFVWSKIAEILGDAQLPPTLGTVMLGSAPVTKTFLRGLLEILDPQTTVLSIYGLTEAGPVCVATAQEKLAWEGEGDWLGSPVEGTTVSIDEDDEVGEILVRGPSVCAGYLGHPLAQGEPLRTGDLGRMTEVSGVVPGLVLVGRQKDMIIRRGVNIYPGLLEPPLLSASREAGLGLRDCAVVGVWNDAKQDEEVLLFVVPGADTSVSVDAVQRAAVTCFGAESAPDRVLVIEEMPRTGRQHKIDRRALREMAGEAPNMPTIADRLHDAALPYGFGAFARKYGGLLRSEHAPVSVMAQAIFRLSLWGLAQATWALDEVISPHWREATGLGPLFILGHQRSGTTFLHRLLAADVTHARALTLQEMLLPAVSFQELVDAVDGMDRRLGRPLGSRFEALEDRLLAESDKIHRIRFEEIEEDEFVLWSIFSSILCANDAPSTVAERQLDELRHFEEWPREHQERVLGYYRDVLKRKLYRDHDGDPSSRWIVSKNPAFSQKIPALMEVFPDARFIYLVRNPLEAIPSRLSMFREIWHRRFPDFEALTPAHVETILEDSYRTYLFAERDFAAVPEARKLVIRHEELRADPGATVREIYEHFKLPPPDEALEAALAALPERKHAKRELVLEEFFLDEARLRADLAPVFERYGF